MPPSLVEVGNHAATVEDFINDLGIFSPEQITLLEENTRGQSENEIWKTQRMGRITASSMHRVMTKVKSLESDSTSAAVSTESLVNSITGCNNCLQVPALLYGQQMEPEAREAYKNEQKSKHKNLNVSTCGLFVLRKHPFIGASPDALISCNCCGDGLLEIKCPFSIADKSPCDANLPYLKKDSMGSLKLQQNNSYYSQIQAQLGVCGKKWCDFFVYTRHGFYLERVTFNENWWTNLQLAAEFFFIHYVAPELIRKKKC